MGWRMIGIYQCPQWRLYLQKIFNRTLNKLKSCAVTVKNQALLLEIAVKRWKRNRSKEMTLRSKTRNLWHLDLLHPVVIANEQIILQKNAGVVPIPLIDPNGSNKTIQQTVGMKGKKKEIWTIQDPSQILKTPETGQTTTPRGTLHISETTCYIWPAHQSIPLSKNFEHRNCITCLAKQMEKAFVQINNIMHMIHKTLPTYYHDYTEDFDTQFRPLPEVFVKDTFRWPSIWTWHLWSWRFIRSRQIGVQNYSL